ncbi:MAG: sugar phosphate nucleotidyltransferase [Elusimicrobiota bacterium]
MANVRTAARKYPEYGAKVVEKAVLLASGKGTRLRKKFKDTPKPLVRLYEKPLAYYQVKQFYDYGIKELGLVVNSRTESLTGILKSEFKDLNIVPLFQKKSNGTAKALLKAKNFTGSQNFFMTYSDNIGNFRLKNLEKSSGLGAVHITYNKDNPGTALVDLDNNRITKIYEKPESKAPKNRLYPVFIFSPAIYKYLENVKMGKTGEYELSNAINDGIKDGKKFYYSVNNTKRINLNTPRDFKEARKFLDSQGS